MTLKGYTLVTFQITWFGRVYKNVFIVSLVFYDMSVRDQI